MRRRAAIRMWSWPTAWAAWTLSGCAGTAASPAATQAFHRDQSAVPAVTTDRPPEPIAAPAPRPAASVEAAPGAVDASAPPTEPAPAIANEASLRHALATAADPTAAALELAAELAANERHEDALVVLDTALARHRAAVLRIAKAGVLRDLGQRHLAVRELRALRGDEGAAALHPSLLFELAELEWLEGDIANAAATLQQIGDVHGDDAWTGAHRDEWQAMRAAVARGVRPSKMRARDLLGNLRGAPLATERVAVLEQLHAAAPGTSDLRQELRERAIAIAIGDDAAPVRARAIQLATPGAEWADAFCRAALADEAPLVRQVAAARTAVLLGPLAEPLLLECLASETDPTTFLAMHDALAQAAGAPAEVAAAATAADRAAVVARWRTRLSR